MLGLEDWPTSRATLAQLHHLEAEIRYQLPSILLEEATPILNDLLAELMSQPEVQSPTAWLPVLESHGVPLTTSETGPAHQSGAASATQIRSSQQKMLMIGSRFFAPPSNTPAAGRRFRIWPGITPENFSRKA